MEQKTGQRMRHQMEARWKELMMMELMEFDREDEDHGTMSSTVPAKRASFRGLGACVSQPPPSALRPPFADLRTHFSDLDSNISRIGSPTRKDILIHWCYFDSSVPRNG
jgi:hypothetical protein